MKIAVTSQNRKTVTNHAGKCRNFWIYDIVDRQINNKTLVELSMEETFHATKDTPALLGAIDVLITASMGPGLSKRLAKQAIEAMITEETDPEAAVIAYLNQDA